MDNQHDAPQPPPISEPTHPNLPPSPEDARRLKVAQNLIMIASIAGPLSLFFGSFWLSGSGLVCAIIGYRRIKKLMDKRTKISEAAAYFRRSGIVAIVISAVITILNVISFFILLPIVIEMIQSGDYGDLLPKVAQNATSTWG